MRVQVRVGKRRVKGVQKRVKKARDPEKKHVEKMYTLARLSNKQKQLANQQNGSYEPQNI